MCANRTNTIVSNVDLLVRNTSYTDVWGDETTYEYDQVGRLIETVSPRQGTLGTLYQDGTGRPEAVRLDGQVKATATYRSNGQIETVAYANGTGGEFDYDTYDRAVAGIFTITGSGTRLAGDEVTRDLAGRVIDQAIDTGGPTLVDSNTAGPNMVYDAAGRLTQWHGPSGTIDYGYGTAACGNPDAGLNTNRTSLTTSSGSTTYCYDNADRLIDDGTTTVTYDDWGQTVTLDGTTFVWDSAGRHIGTTSGTTSVTYLRDPLGRIVERRLGGTTVVRLGYTGPGDAADTTMLPNNATGDRFVGLPGGVLLTATTGTASTWSYPNMHGDVIATANQAGAKQSATATYDPYGGATTNPTNVLGNADYNWHGSSQVLHEHQAGLPPIVELGARPYHPGLGRFLTTDPIEGGCANTYMYVFGDPINQSDLIGQGLLGDIWGGIKRAGGWVWDQYKCHQSAIESMVLGAIAMAAMFELLPLALGYMAVSGGFMMSARDIIQGINNKNDDQLVGGILSMTFFAASGGLGALQKSFVALGPEYGPLVTAAHAYEAGIGVAEFGYVGASSRC